MVAIKDRRSQLDWAAVHRELRRPGVTPQLLWEEHRAAHPDGYGYGSSRTEVTDCRSKVRQCCALHRERAYS
jgi:transposase